MCRKGEVGKKEMEKLKENIREYIRELREPFSANNIAKKFNISWNTARTILLELALEGEVEVLKTTKSYVFIPRRDYKNEGQQIPAQRAN